MGKILSLIERRKERRGLMWSLGVVSGNVSISLSRGVLKPGSTHSNEFDADLDVGTIEKVKFLWNNHVINPTLPKVGASKITVQKGEEKTVYVSLPARAYGCWERFLFAGTTQPRESSWGRQGPERSEVGLYHRNAADGTRYLLLASSVC